MRGFYFSKGVNFMADLRRNYIYRSALALVEATFLWRSSLLLFHFMVVWGNVVPLAMTGKYRNIRNSSVKYNLGLESTLLGKDQSQ